MSALMCQDPEAGKEEASNKAVESPKRDAEDQWEIGASQQDSRVEQTAYCYEIADHVAVGADH